MVDNVTRQHMEYSGLITILFGSGHEEEYL